jgi:beta-1,4-mannosyltransferase
MFPGKGMENNNRYIDILVESLGAAGVEVESWDKHVSLQNGDIFHVHWPDLIADIRARKWQTLRGQLIHQNFFRTVDRTRSRGGAVVWTVHDLQPHDASLRETPFQRSLMARFASKVDYLLSLTYAGIGEIHQCMPALREVRCAVARHPHYRGKLGDGSIDAAARLRLGIQPQHKVFALLGNMRPNKRPDLVLRAFREFPRDQAFLILAGSASVQMQQDLRGLARGMSNIRLDLRRIPEKELKELYAVTDMLVFPGMDYFNSGTIYTSLSLGVPVIAAWSSSNEEIQKLVGSRWLHLYRGDLTGRTLESAKAELIERSRDEICDLTAFSPQRCAQQHIEAYQAAMQLRRR